MITRYVFLKLKDEFANPQGRTEVVARTRAALPGIPRVVAVRVGAAAEERTLGAWDVSVEVDFSTMDDVKAYIPDPAHRKFVDEFLKPRLEVIKAWNFETGG